MPAANTGVTKRPRRPGPPRGTEEIDQLILTAEGSVLLWRRIVSQGLDMPGYDRLLLALYNYARPLLPGMILNGNMWVILAEIGRPRPKLKLSWDDAQTLAADTLTDALARFHTLTASGKGWRPEGGDTGPEAISSYFINTCGRAFADVYLGWLREYRRQARHVDPALLAGLSDMPDDETEPGPDIDQMLANCPPGEREVALLKAAGCPNSEIVDRTGRSPRSVEGLVYRLRRRLKPFYKPRGGTSEH